jgi:hypothetical protein
MRRCLAYVMWCARAAPVNVAKCSNAVATRESGVLYGLAGRQERGGLCPVSRPALESTQPPLVLLGIRLWDM